MIVWTFAVPAAELVLLFLSALFNQWLTGKMAFLRRFELVALILLWYLVLLVGALLGGIGAK
jgi:hypothetical protein